MSELIWTGHPCLKFQLNYSARVLVADAGSQRVLNISIQVIRLTDCTRCFKVLMI